MLNLSSSGCAPQATSLLNPSAPKNGGFDPSNPAGSVVAVSTIAQPVQQPFSPRFYPSGEPAGKFCALIIKSRLGVVWKSTWRRRYRLRCS
jgi:hypothetical protein